MAGRMAPQDATMYWLAERTRNDLFLVYSFADRGVPTAELRARVQRRSALIPDLRVRLRAVPRDLDYPSWVPCAFSASQFIEHDLPQADWRGLQTAIGELLGTGVDAADRPWRIHLFRGVTGPPMRAEAEELATVVVLQMSHALADGKRAAEIARSLFGEDEPPRPGRSSFSRKPLLGVRLRAAQPTAGVGQPTAGVGQPTAGVGLGTASAVLWMASEGLRTANAGLRMAAGIVRAPVQVLQTLVRGYQAYRAQQILAELTESGRLPAPGPSFIPSAVNQPGAQPNSVHQARMLVFDAADLRIPDRTVTVLVLTAVSLALPNYLTTLGKPVDESGAQVPMARSGKARARNNYRSLGVDLHIDEPDLRRRAARIAVTLADRRTRAEHPLLSAQDRVTEVTPAAFLRRDLARYPLDTVPDTISGHTVVSSVHRGPADLSFGGPVRFTAGFPAIGSVMHLTHGVHGLGDTVTISLHADTGAVPDIDTYAGFLDAALREVRAAHQQ
ncbi:wax ester/triacylglycerol synthase domain-containing protein [Nocardia sp. NPDC051832]|uniref:wax ester/triacylglycerol synthase domain-containing protein n=1 Tax=Nocardia sp. NPDC051832 TaxID=3155673 RepID=UPI00342C31CD